MDAVAGVVVGIAAVAGVMAVCKFAGRRARAFREALRGRRGEESVIELERDPETGIYRAK